MERLDAQEVGVKLNQLGVDGSIGDEADVLVRDKEQERGRAERKVRGGGPKRSGAGFDQADGEVVRAGRLERVATQVQTLCADRLIALPGVIQVVMEAALTHVPFHLVGSTTK